MKIAGKVTTRTEVTQGHSQIRVTAEVDLGDGVKRPAEVIISTPDLAVFDRFGRDQEVSFEL